MHANISISKSIRQFKSSLNEKKTAEDKKEFEDT